MDFSTGQERLIQIFQGNFCRASEINVEESDLNLSIEKLIMQVTVVSLLIKLICVAV